MRTLALAPLALLLSACSMVGAPASSPTPAPTQVTVAYSAITAAELPLWVGQEAGIFAKHGLAVTATLVSGGSASMAALLSGQVQVDEGGGSDALSADAGGADVVLLATMMPVYPYVFEVPADIQKPNDLRGKKISTGAPGSSGDTSVRAVLRKVGIDPDKDVTILHMQSRQASIEALINGAVQGTNAQPTETAEIESRGFHPLEGLPYQQLPAAETATMVKKSWLAANHSTAQAYIDAEVEAIARTRADKPLAVSLLKRNFKSDDDKTMSAAYDFFMAKVIPPLPYPRAEQFTDPLAELTVRNPALKSFDVNSLLDPSLVQSAESRGLHNVK